MKWKYEIGAYVEYLFDYKKVDATAFRIVSILGLTDWCGSPAYYITPSEMGNLLLESEIIRELTPDEVLINRLAE